MQTTFLFFVDSGHGWLKVPHLELMRLGIADLVSRFSYYKDGFVYLEEDCDAPLFAQARADEGNPITLRVCRAERQSRIRSYSHYGT